MTARLPTSHVTGAELKPRKPSVEGAKSTGLKVPEGGRPYPPPPPAVDMFSPEWHEHVLEKAEIIDRAARSGE